MAVSQVQQSSMVLVFDGGPDDEGNAIKKRKSFNNVKSDATPDQLYTVAQVLTALQQYPLILIERNDTSEING